jgi:outer membrane lipoprotein-sorting protein
MSRQVTGAELWIGDGNGLPIQQKIVFTSGDYWLVNYSDIKFNQPLSDNDLKLKIPGDAQTQHPRL